MGAGNVLHSGENRESYICDIFSDGDFEIRADTKLVDEYGSDTDDGDKGGDDDGDGGDGGNGGQKSSARGRAVGPAIVTGTRIDQRPMGNES